MGAAIACAKAGVTTGEWAGVLREVFGEFRAPTGASAAVSEGTGRAELAAVRERVRATGEELGTRLRMLVGKPGLDGHSNGAEQVAVRARDVGFEVVYQGIRLTPAQIVAAAVRGGRATSSGSRSCRARTCRSCPPSCSRGCARRAAVDVPVIVGGIIPPEDADACSSRASPRCSHPRTTGSPRCSTRSSTSCEKPAASVLDIRIVIDRISARKLPTG